MTFDRVILILLAIHEKKGVEEMEQVIGASRQIVQRYLAKLQEGGFYTAEMGKSGKKIKTRSRKLTKTGTQYLRNCGYDI